VERNPPKLTGFIQKLKSAAFTRWKYNLLKWDTVNPAFPSIPTADFKPALAKFLVVTDALSNSWIGVMQGQRLAANALRINSSVNIL